jgi:hypothetical protein
MWLTVLEEEKPGAAAASSSASSSLLSPASLRIKFSVSQPDIGRPAFRFRLQWTVLLLGEDEAVVKVEGSGVREAAAAAPTHRMEWSEKDAADRQRDEQQQSDWLQQVRLTRRGKTEQRREEGGGRGEEGGEREAAAAAGGSEAVRRQEAAAELQLDIAASKRRTE